MSDILGITEKQLAALPFLVSAPSVKAGCNLAQISRKTFYQWKNQPKFETHLKTFKAIYTLIGHCAFKLTNEDIQDVIEDGIMEGFIVGWKGIGSFFGVSGRTVKRWHKKYGMPIRRTPENRPAITKYEAYHWLIEFNKEMEKL